MVCEDTPKRDSRLQCSARSILWGQEVREFLLHVPYRLKIEELTLPQVSLRLLPGVGVQLNLHTKVGLHGSG